MDKAVQILLGAMILVLLVRACVLAMRAWRDGEGASEAPQG